MTPTPTIKSITLSDGTHLEDRGEKRLAKMGDWIVDEGEVVLWENDYASKAIHPILSPVEAPAGKIERRGSWRIYDASNGRVATNSLPANPLIDAACAVVNSMAYTDPVAESALAKLAAALEPFTQAVKEERFRVVQEDDDFFVVDYDPDNYRDVGKFYTAEDAKAFAAMKNQEANQ